MLMVEKLISELQKIVQNLPESHGDSGSKASLNDCVMAAFSAFFVQDPYILLALRKIEMSYGFDGRLPLYGIDSLPSKKNIRKRLDKLDCEKFYPAFDFAIEQLVNFQGLKKFKRIDDRIPIAFSGWQFHSSERINCPYCVRNFGSNSSDYPFAHSVLSAAIVADGHINVVPLQPEFITPEDGDNRQKCEQIAAHRWINKHLSNYQHLRPVILGDAHYSDYTLCEKILDQDCDFIFTAKQKSHSTLYRYLDGMPLETKTVYTEQALSRHKSKETRTYRWCSHEIPLNVEETLQVYWISFTIQIQDKTTYNRHFLTSIQPTAENIETLIANARMRWKINKKTFHMLWDNGHHRFEWQDELDLDAYEGMRFYRVPDREYKIGHGRNNVSNVLLTLNLIAYSFFAVCNQTDEIWQEARERWGFMRYVSKYAGMNTDWTSLLENFIKRSHPT